MGRAAGLKIRQQMARGAVYRRQPTRIETRRTEMRRTGTGRTESRPLRYRRARLVETARITRYHDERPAATAVASDELLREAEERQYGSSRQSGSQHGLSEPAAAAEADTAGNYQPGTAQPATLAERSAEQSAQGIGKGASEQLEHSAEAPAATGAALAEAAVESSDDSHGLSADVPASEPSASARSESEVASLTIPHGAMPAPLRGSLASLQRQNDRLTAEGLERIENEDDLASRIANHLLVPVPVSDALVVNPALPPNHRYCRPWTAQFVADLAREHEALFHRPLEVSSAVRTVEYQRHLMLINGNAAPAEGDIVSPHLTGATIDIAKEGLTRSEINWMRRRLLQLEEAGKIDVEEEFQQSCFHITVYTTYAPTRPVRRAVHQQPSTPANTPVESADGDATEGL